MDINSIEQEQIYRQMTASQKWQQVVLLRETAWSIKRAGLRSKRPDWSDLEIENAVRKIFLYAVS